MMPATINEADYAEALRLAAKIEKMGWSKEGYTALIAKALLAADRDAERFRFLQNITALQAQAFFWIFQSRSKRAEAIDEAMAALIDRGQT